jgi:hypothetical protein
MEILEFIRQPWPWYMPLSWTYSSGIINPGNKSFGISGTLRHACAMYVSQRLFLPTIGKRNMEYFFVLGF